MNVHSFLVKANDLDTDNVRPTASVAERRVPENGLSPVRSARVQQHLRSSPVTDRAHILLWTDQPAAYLDAVKAAGLVETLKGEGPFTVFAPTDEAFAKLPAGTVEDLLKPENKEKLVDILTYHVVSGKVMAAAAVKLDKATAVNKKEIKLAVKDGGLMLNDSAKVAKPDI